jgi:PAS domain S-box-containing protein
MNLMPRHLMDISMDIICTLDKQGNFLEVSSATTNILGYQPAELLGKCYKELLYTGDIKKTIAAEKKLLKTCLLKSFRTHFIHKTGEPVLIEWQASYDPQSETRYAIGKDLGREQPAITTDEALLLKSEGFFRKIFKENPTAMFVYDPATLKFVLVNHAAIQQYGYTREEFDQMKITDLRPEKELKGFMKQLKQYLQNDHNTAYDIQKTKNGELINIVTYGQNLFIEGRKLRFITCMNVTHIKSNEKQLNLFESIITNVDDGIMITSETRTGLPKIVYTNRAFEKITGYSSKELLGKQVSVMWGADTDKDQLKKLRRSLQLGEPFFGELLNYKKNGEPFWISLNIAPVKNESGEVKNYIGISRDITEKQRIEVEKEHLVRDLIQSNKEVRQFSFITAHNFRAPLTNIIAILQLIETGNMDEQNKRLIRLLKASSYQLNETIQDLVNILILKEGAIPEKTLVDIEAGFSNTLQHHINAITGAHAQVVLNFSEKWIRFHPATLTSIFDQLISNAIKFRKVDEPLVIKVSTEKENGFTRLIFEDNGLGVNYKTVKDQLFGLYQRFHPDTEGKGLGLFMVKAQLESMDAICKVESSVNKGFKIIIGIPDK